MKASFVLTALLPTLTLLGCATQPLPVAVSFPKLPPPPASVTAYATPENNLIEDSVKLLEVYTATLRASLKKASGQGI